MTTRYAQMIPMIQTMAWGTSAGEEFSIVEVGVHRGLRAVMLCEAALKAFPGQVGYTGFDVFETESEAFHASALNGKGVAQRAEAERRLGALHREFPGRFTWRLVTGDTRQTLHPHPVRARFAFIDGDHRVEVISGDAVAIDADLMVFDDYYLPDAAGRMPVDLDAHGANRVVAQMRESGWRCTLLPAGDLCKHGAVAHLAALERSE